MTRERDRGCGFGCESNGERELKVGILTADGLGGVWGSLTA